MPDSVQPIRHSAITASTSRKGGRGKRTPFTLNEEPPPESDATDDPTETPHHPRCSERDVGHKPDDEEGATLDVTG